MVKNHLADRQFIYKEKKRLVWQLKNVSAVVMVIDKRHRVDKMFVGQMFVGKMFVDKMFVGQMSVGQMERIIADLTNNYVGQMSIGQMFWVNFQDRSCINQSVGQMSVLQMPVGQMFVGQMFVGQMFVGHMA